LFVFKRSRECNSEHGPLAYRLFFRRFILNDVPMFDKDSVLNAHNICCNPVHRLADARKIVRVRLQSFFGRDSRADISDAHGAGVGCDGWFPASRPEQLGWSGCGHYPP
jgi:hypothetical protein